MPEINHLSIFSSGLIVADAHKAAVGASNDRSQPVVDPSETANYGCLQRACRPRQYAGTGRAVFFEHLERRACMQVGDRREVQLGILGIWEARRQFWIKVLTVSPMTQSITAEPFNHSPVCFFILL